MKARKKPVVVDVMRLKMCSARSYRKCKEFVGDAWIDYFVDGSCVNRDDMPSYYPAIKTLEGTMKISDGDYIIKGIHGELYPCKPDIFEETYEILGEDDKR